MKFKSLWDLLSILEHLNRDMVLHHSVQWKMCGNMHSMRCAYLKGTSKTCFRREYNSLRRTLSYMAASRSLLWKGVEKPFGCSPVRKRLDKWAMIPTEKATGSFLVTCCQLFYSISMQQSAHHVQLIHKQVLLCRFVCMSQLHNCWAGLLLIQTAVHRWKVFCVSTKHTYHTFITWIVSFSRD